MAQDATQPDPFDRLDEERPPSLPKLQPGDRFSGRVLRISRHYGRYSEYPLLTLALKRAKLAEHPDVGSWPTVAWHVVNSVAQKELARHRVKVGETIAVEYLGRRESKTGTGDYHAWKVLVDRAEQEFDWREFADGDSPQTPPRSDIQGGSSPAEDEDIPF